MVNKRGPVLFILLCLLSFYASASDEIEMADKMRSDGKIYVVVAVMAIVFAGVAVYLFMMDRKLSRMEKMLKEKK